MNECRKCGKTNLETKIYVSKNKRKGICKTCLTALSHNRQYNMDFVIGQLIKKTKRAKLRKGFEHNLTKQYLLHIYFIQSKRCPLTGILFDVYANKPSVDRIDNTKGYIEGNVQLVTYWANIARHTLSIDQFIKNCRKVALNHPIEVKTPFSNPL